jgi:hypothetical protein
MACFLVKYVQESANVKVRELKTFVDTEFNCKISKRKFWDAK